MCLSHNSSDTTTSSKSNRSLRQGEPRKLTRATRKVPCVPHHTCISQQYLLGHWHQHGISKHAGITDHLDVWMVFAEVIPKLQQMDAAPHPYHMSQPAPTLTHQIWAVEDKFDSSKVLDECRMWLHLPLWTTNKIPHKARRWGQYKQDCAWDVPRLVQVLCYPARARPREESKGWFQCYLLQIWSNSSNLPVKNA